MYVLDRFRMRSLASRAVAALAVLVAPLAACTAPTQATRPHTYVVLYSGTASPAIAQIGVHKAGGNLLAVYPEIGVAIARSGDATFAQKLRHGSGVAAVASTERYAMRLPDSGGVQNAGGPEETSADPGTRQQNGTGGSLAALQWDMVQIHAVEAHRITQGSQKVLVGDIDTGLDYTHPNLAPNVDFANSVSCIGGTPNQSPSAWADDNGHGTHTAGTIAATSQNNSLGIDGVAPNVRIAGIKAGDSAGYFFPEAVVCAFMWAGNHHMDVTNNSYYADPWLYNCLNDPDQLAIWTAEKRAIDFAMGKGVTVVVAAGNFVDDIAHPSIDPTSPDFPPNTEVLRDVSQNCFTVPSMVPGVITVSADGSKLLKSYYSNYGIGYIKVTAPGGDRRFQKTADAGGGRVLSTYPASLFDPTNPLEFQACAEGTCGTYAWLQGTSMASPHVAGLAALIVSKMKSRNRRGDGDRVSPARVLEVLTGTADPLPCPANPYLPAFHQFSLPNGPPAHCEGTPANNSFYGAGQINALRALTEN